MALWWQCSLILLGEWCNGDRGLGPWGGRCSHSTVPCLLLCTTDRKDRTDEGANPVPSRAACCVPTVRAGGRQLAMGQAWRCAASPCAALCLHSSNSAFLLFWDQAKALLHFLQMIKRGIEIARGNLKHSEWGNFPSLILTWNTVVRRSEVFLPTYSKKEEHSWISCHPHSDLGSLFLLLVVLWHMDVSAQSRMGRADGLCIWVLLGYSGMSLMLMACPSKPFLCVLPCCSALLTQNGWELLSIYISDRIPSFNPGDLCCFFNCSLQCFPIFVSHPLVV